MADNTYISSEKEEERIGIFVVLRRFLRMDSSISEVIHIRFLPQILFLSFLALVYIGNRHLVEKKIRSIGKLEVEVQDLRADYTTLKSDLMFQSKQSEVIKNAKKMGLIVPKSSPILIKVKEDEH